MNKKLKGREIKGTFSPEQNMGLFPRRKRRLIEMDLDYI